MPLPEALSGHVSLRGREIYFLLLHKNLFFVTGSICPHATVSFFGRILSSLDFQDFALVRDPALKFIPCNKCLVRVSSRATAKLWLILASSWTKSWNPIFLSPNLAISPASAIPEVPGGPRASVSHGVLSENVVPSHVDDMRLLCPSITRGDDQSAGAFSHAPTTPANRNQSLAENLGGKLENPG